MATLDGDEFTELVDGDFPRLDLVDKSANGTRFLIMKRSDDSPNLMSSDMVHELLKAEESDDMANTVEAIAKADEPDLDVTEVLADPADGSVQVDESTPGSAAWESVDAATAQKWTAIASRLQNALTILAGREAQEAATGDSGDSSNVWDLEDASGAVQFAIDTLAAYAVGEEQEVQIDAELAKAMHSLEDTSELETIEQSTSLLKAGRTLSAANENLLRAAGDSILKVLASLPAPEPDVAAVAKAEESNVAEQEAVAKAQKIAELPRGLADSLPADEVAKLAGAEVEPVETADVAKAETDETPAVPADVVKADGDLTIVYDSTGKALGVVKTTQIQSVAGESGSGDAPDDAPDDAPAADATDDTAGQGDEATAPAPAAAVPDAAPAAPVVKGTNEADGVKPSIEEIVQAAIAKASAEQSEVVKALRDEINALKAPATPKAYANGAVPIMRGQDLMPGGKAPVQKASIEALRDASHNAGDAVTKRMIDDQRTELAFQMLSGQRPPVSA